MRSNQGLQACQVRPPVSRPALYRLAWPLGQPVIKKFAPPRGVGKAQHKKCPGGHTQLLLGQLGHAGFKSEVSFFCNFPVLFLEQPRQRPSHGTKKSKN